MPKVTIYKDSCPTLTAYKTVSVSSYDTIVEMSPADWAEYKQIEDKYAEWQERLAILAEKHKGKSKPHNKSESRKHVNGSAGCYVKITGNL